MNNNFDNNGNNGYVPNETQSSNQGQFYFSGNNMGGAPTPQPQPPKKDNKAGLIIGITVAVLVVAVVLSALAIGVMYFYRSIMEDYLPLDSNSAAESENETYNDETEASDKKLPGKDSVAEVNTSETVDGNAMSIVDTVAAVKDSVVEIRTESVKSGGGMYGQYISSGAGSGVIISDTGLVMTNNHVIEGANKITVTLTSGKTYEATVIGADSDNDIAVISFDPGSEKLTAAKNGNSDLIVTGQSVIVIGNPLGQLGGTVTSGIISCTEREIEVEDIGTMTLIQTDAAINPGNSGGGMFNLNGELIGIINAGYSGTSVDGLGFAIPVNTAWSVARELVEYGYVKGKASLGISVVNVSNSYYALQYFRSYNTGVYVFETNDKVGVQYGDRIVAIDDYEVTDSSDISNYLKKCSVGDTVTLSLVRSQRTVSVKVTLQEKVPEASK